jgi:hypothetical protein
MKLSNLLFLLSNIILALIITTLLAAGDVSLSNTLYGGSGSINEGLNFVNMNYQNDISITPSEATSAATGYSSNNKGTSKVGDSITLSSSQGPAKAEISVDAKRISFANSMVTGANANEMQISYGLETGSALARYSNSYTSADENIESINAIYGQRIAANPNEFTSIGNGKLIGSGHLLHNIQISHNGKSSHLETSLTTLEINKDNAPADHYLDVYSNGNNGEAKSIVDLKSEPHNNALGTISMTGTGTSLDPRTINTAIDPYYPYIILPPGMKISDYLKIKVSDYVDSLPDLKNKETGKNLKDQIKTDFSKYDFSKLDNPFGKSGDLIGGIGQELYMGYKIS